MSAYGTHCIGASHIRDNAETEFSLSEHWENVAKLQQNVTVCEWTQGIDLSENKAKVVFVRRFVIVYRWLGQCIILSSKKANMPIYTTS
ncbi:tRNA 5-methylaminomethyl-2-thiouridine biosynthesis bifunctional protein MnmC [Mannheimia haemolytica]|nr:tRNA 5-methylaminomethyl-2-thiouridine biosynthesis bifunctional protein MnmC [Mannheimia haemolytica]